ncbi:MAG TPA: methionyl-tRNA formyltransferase [Thermoleophilaceae bacterium]
MRTVYMGTSDFAVAVLRRLADSPHSPTLVVTRPDRPRGRGRKLQPPPVAIAARELGLEVFQPDSVNSDEGRARIAAEQPGEVLICAFGALIKEPLLSEHPMLNVHPSLLPRWRGAAPIERAIEAGDELTGVTIMRPTAELDAGPICLQRDEAVRPDDDFGSLSPRLAVLGGELLVEVLGKRPDCVPQPEDGVTIAPKIESEERRLDPSAGSQTLVRRVRALNPHVGTWIELHGGERLGVRRAQVAEESAAPGELVAVNGRLLWGCAGGALELLMVQPPGGRAMDAADFLRGHGARLVRG